MHFDFLTLQFKHAVLAFFRIIFSTAVMVCCQCSNGGKGNEMGVGGMGDLGWSLTRGLRGMRDLEWS